MKTIQIEEIANLVHGVLVGHTSQAITGPEQLETANETQISFIGSKKYVRFWGHSKACAAIVEENLMVEPGLNRALVKVKNADLAMALLLEYFIPDSPHFDTDIHPAAIIQPSASIGAETKIGAGCYIGAHVKIGKRVTVYPNVTILDESTLGDGTVIWSGTVIRERCTIGRNCILHPNVTIGADGFGYRPSPDGRGLIKIPHIGNVIIGDGVEIGAGSCVDRGKFSATILGDGTKIDNLVQIGHNSKLGRSCIMAGSSGLAGSVTLGDGVIIGGSASISDHITIGNGAVVGGGSGVMHDIPDGKTVLGYPAEDYRQTLKQWAILRKLAKDK